MFSEAHPIFRQVLRFFMLPYCYYQALSRAKGKRSFIGIAFDLLELFFLYKTYPDHYYFCRLWEIEKKEWRYYFGSSYHPFQRMKLRKRVQRFEYQVLFNDKAVCEQLCRGTGVRMPHTYGMIGPELSSRDKITLWFKESLADSLIIKPILGHGGAGIVMARKQGNTIQIHHKNSTQPLSEFIMPTEAIVQEVLKQDERMAVFSSSSINTIRIVTFFSKRGEIIIVSATMRCGVGISFVDNWSAGGVAVGIDCDTGKLRKYAYDKNSKRYEQHPSSKVVFENFQIPEWKKMCAVAEKIQAACPFYSLLGMDVSLLEGGEPVLIEVNANPDLVFQEQTSTPLLKNKTALKAFSEDDLLVNKYQKSLLNSI
jgi:hypothetical protein